VLPRASAVDHNFVEGIDKSAGVRAHTRPPDWKAVEDLLTLIARAIQQLHTYPSTSPLCISAIEASQRALAALDARDQLTLRVTPAELVVDDVPTGRGTQVGQELARRLHKASVASVTLSRAATTREVERFCEDLIRCSEKTAPGVTLLEMMTEHGVDRIAIEMASRPEVLEVPAVPATAAADLQHERARFEAQLAKGGVVNHLYPPQKGWVRVDPSSAPASVSLLDLAVLADDPATLAGMLLRLTDDVSDVPPAEALEKKYSDVAMLISALDPRVARRMFGKLARAVLDLEPANRQALLRRTVLPGLLDGRVDGAILRDFPDVDLAESLCLLLDLETAAPELLTTALSRLELPADRHAAMVPLLDARLKQREAAAADSGRQTSLTRHARDLVKVDAAGGKSFADFAAFDLSLDGQAAAALEYIRAAVPETDAIGDQLTCLWHLLSLEPNPEAVSRFLDRSFELLSALEHASRGGELPSWLAGYRDLAGRLRESRPDVSAVLAGQLAAFCTIERAAWIADLSLCGADGKQAASAIIDSLGAAVGPPLVALLGRESSDSRSGPGRARVVSQLLTEHAALVAPAVAPLLERSSPGVTRTLLRVLGSAGPGHEPLIASYVSSGDEQVAREALRALARVGTAKAAALVVAEIEQQRGTLSAAAEETLWHFPTAEALRHTRELLGRRDFTTRHPQATERLLDRAARAGAVDLQPILHELAPLRFRIWNPAVARLARKAHAMLQDARRT
jgi:hypothetical protein